MDHFLLALGKALGLGLVTSISPCPLATNIAAVSFIGKNLEKTRRVFLSSLAYTLGRTAAYLALGALIVTSLLSVPEVSRFLQRYMNRLLGPLLILVGMVLLELIKLNFQISISGEKIRKRPVGGGFLGAGLLGILFALSFCPISAAFFFGGLIPLSIQHESRIWLPLLYGVGTALPVLLFALMIALGTQSLSRTFNKVSQLERWARPATGIIFILVGFYYSLTYIFKISMG